MENAHAWAAEGAPHGSAVVAVVQEAARGRQGKVWSAPVGGLWLSVVCRPRDSRNLDALSLRVGMAVAKSVEELARGGVAVQLKWPNDLYVEGAKVAGLLTEARWSGEDCRWVVIGLGLNLLNSLPEELVGLATSIRDHLPADHHDDLEPGRCATAFAATIAAAARGGELSPEELSRWNLRDMLGGVTVKSPVSGTIAGITTTGALKVLSADGSTVEVASGVVTLGN
jgi:BirA family biotin operon repressor/biotin-[acetyl-CoA-carboxylase] ligase